MFNSIFSLLHVIFLLDAKTSVLISSGLIDDRTPVLVRVLSVVSAPASSHQLMSFAVLCFSSFIFLLHILLHILNSSLLAGRLLFRNLGCALAKWSAYVITSREVAGLIPSQACRFSLVHLPWASCNKTKESVGVFQVK